MLYKAFSRMPDIFDNKILLQGQEYFNKENVLNIRLSEGLIKARVRGSGGRIYNVYMDLKQWPKQPARCGCSINNCKHAAACLFALYSREQKSAKGQVKESQKQMEHWINQIQSQQEEQRKKLATHQLIYLLDLNFTDFEHKIWIELALAKILKRGGLGNKIPFNRLTQQKRQHFTADDKEIVSQLIYRSDTQGYFDQLPLRNSDVLEKTLTTKRVYLREQPEILIELGQPLTVECQWQLQVNGKQKLQLVSKEDDKEVKPLLLDRPWYWDFQQKKLGRLNIDYSSSQLHYLLSLPAVSLNEADETIESITTKMANIPTPLSFDRTETHEIIPKPIINFNSTTLISDAASETKDHLLTVKPCFSYHDNTIPFQERSQFVFNKEANVLHRYKRKFQYEQDKMDELAQFLSLRLPTPIEKKKSDKDLTAQFVMTDFDDNENLNVLYQDIIPQLKQRGWEVYFNSPLYQETIHADDLVWFSDLNNTGYDFFSYQLGIQIDGESINIVPLIVNLINQHGSIQELEELPDNQKITLSVTQEKLLAIEIGRIKPLIRLLVQHGIRNIDQSKQQIEISHYQLVLMQEIEQAVKATSARWQGAEVLRNKLNQLTDIKALPDVSVPQKLNSTLRDYQKEGLNWLQCLRENKFGGVLADDMGLGKTVQTLAHLQYEKERGRLKKARLIVAPTSLVGNWQAEAKRFTPELDVFVFHGSDRCENEFAKYDVIITTYGLIQRDKNIFLKDTFYYLILDESQFIKNAKTKTTQIIQQIKAEYRLCLTGTPLENHLGELWSLFHFLMPGLLGDSRQFKRWFKNPIEKQGDEKRKEILAQRISPFILRRTKNEVAKELPKKSEMTQFIELSGSQRDLYETLRISMEQKVKEAISLHGLRKSHIIVLDALLKLRQICCDPRLLPFSDADLSYDSSAKLDALMELLDNLMEEGRRVLIFSQFTSMLKLIEERIAQVGYDYLKLTGQTRNRQELVEQFQMGHIPIFLISLKAGGTGLNLTRADTVIHYDPWWNPAVEDQATDRSHRIGQDNPVFVYKMIAKGTVEEVILDMQQRKRQLVEGLFATGESGITNLTETDIEQFFSTNFD